MKSRVAKKVFKRIRHDLARNTCCTMAQNYKVPTICKAVSRVVGVHVDTQTAYTSFVLLSIADLGLLLSPFYTQCNLELAS
jgi:hypothetical protein